MDISNKWTVDEIRKRFDRQVDRFSDPNTPQQLTIDSPFCLELLTDAAKYVCPDATTLLDIGSGGGNYTVKMLGKLPDLHCTLVDLSMPMLERAQQRAKEKTKGKVEIIQADIRHAELRTGYYDIAIAASVFHLLRGDDEWEDVFSKVYRSLKPGGCLWIFDLISHDNACIESLFSSRYVEYLEEVGGPGFPDKVFSYIEKEDSPRSLTYQIELLKKTGFKNIEVLHKNICFAAFGGVKE